MRNRSILSHFCFLIIIFAIPIISKYTVITAEDIWRCGKHIYSNDINENIRRSFIASKRCCSLQQPERKIGGKSNFNITHREI